MARFAATTKAFEKGVENISPEASIKLIEEWEGQLEGYEGKGGKGLLRDLEALKKELGKGDKMKGERVQQLTAKLGQATIKAAEEMEGSGQEKVREIGEALASAGGESSDEE